MIDLMHLENYRENNRIEAKRALGGLPHSIWETYCAFANTLGGVILLGVVEEKDKSLQAIDLPDPGKLIREFWKIVNDPKKLSANILSPEQVKIENVHGKRIVVITVPRAGRRERPVYMDGDPFVGSYRRNGEGDYRCTREEVEAMLRDAARETLDREVLGQTSMEALDYESVRGYRRSMKNARWDAARKPARNMMREPAWDEDWDAAEDEDFLCGIGAAARSGDMGIHPTAAGLLMFGKESEITRVFPEFVLDYREQRKKDGPWKSRVVSSSGDWSGNLYDFYCRVYQDMMEDMEFFAGKEGENKNSAALMRQALREALANCLVNADYYGKQGIVIEKKSDEITFSNPGGFRIDPAAARNGGISDPRNAALMKMFYMLNVGKREGSGISGIYQAWEKQGWNAPKIQEMFEPERIVMSLPVNRKNNSQKIIDYLTEHVQADFGELSRALNLKASEVKTCLDALLRQEIVVAKGQGRKQIYQLKS